MIIDEVVWNTIKNKHCAFRIKYPAIDPGPKLRIFVKISTISPGCAIVGRALCPIRNTPPFEKKKESATCT